MSHKVCPWWIGYLLASSLRRLVHDPAAILAPYVAEGMIVFEPGPGMGYFTLELARLVGPRGRIVAVDVQPRMLLGLRRRAGKAGLLDRIDARQAPGERMGLDDLEGQVDFILAFAVVHELPSAGQFFGEASAALKPGGRLLLAEPRSHVSEGDFAATLRIAGQSGLEIAARPAIPWTRAAVLAKAPDPGGRGARRCPERGSSRPVRPRRGTQTG